MAPDPIPTDTADDRAPTLAEYAARWLANLVRAGYSPRTRRGYTSALRQHWLPTFGAHRLTDLTHRALRAHAETLRDVLAPASVRYTITTLCTLCDSAHRQGLLAEDPTRGLARRLVRTRRREPATFTGAQLARLVDSVHDDPTLWALLVLLARTGLRRSELIALRTTDVVGSRLAVRASYHGAGQHDTTKNAKARLIDLSTDAQHAARILTAHAKPPHGYLFSRTGDRPWHPNEISKRVRAWIDAAGLPRALHAHSLRHTFATVLLEAGEPVTYVASAMGDTVEIVTTTYWSRLHTPRPEAVAVLDRWSESDRHPPIPATRPPLSLLCRHAGGRRR